MIAKKEKNGAVQCRKCILVCLLLVFLLCFTGCDPMESAFMQDSNVVELLRLFGYTPMEELQPQPEEPETPETPEDVQWLVPCDFTKISSPFGYRYHPVTKEWKGHAGVDLAAPKGTPVYASRGGVVLYAGWDSTGGGNYVSIDHDDGFKTQYMHLDTYTVTEGQIVKQGDLVGYVGNTGVTTGYHLHFAIRKYDTAKRTWIPVDPGTYVTLS
jgi:murein DD-endopeptidase MepM/ murein hydrolase activator NlpD